MRNKINYVNSENNLTELVHKVTKRLINKNFKTDKNKEQKYEFINEVVSNSEEFARNIIDANEITDEETIKKVRAVIKETTDELTPKEISSITPELSSNKKFIAIWNLGYKTKLITLSAKKLKMMIFLTN